MDWNGYPQKQSVLFFTDSAVLTASHACVDVSRQDQPLPLLTSLGLMIVQADNLPMQSRSHVVGPC